MNRLAVLLGVSPGALHEELSASAPIPAAQAAMAVGIPADVLRQRPDVRRSERALAAQTARVGVATADLYPKLTLTGTVGLESTSTGSLFSSGSKAYHIGPSLSWAAFRGGAIRSNIEVQDALQEQALAAYEASVLAALQEVEDALKAYAEELQARQHLTEATEAARSAASLAQDLYFSGLSDFQGVLEAQRALYSLEGRLAQSEGSVTANLVRLYKALGGGWTAEGEVALKSRGNH
jgi:outer membrane protein TolC